jgi:release factor glutamine methyltransferase
VANEEWTILKLINWTKGHFERKGIENARLEAELLLAHLLRLKRIDLYTNFNRVLTDEERAAYRELIQRRARHCPSQYIRGKTEFFSTELEVREGVLIPRPETEVLVEQAIEILNTPRDDAGRQRLLLDIGTGSGNIPVAVLKHVPMLKVYATDVSEQALALAAGNASRYGFSERVVFLKGSLFEPLADLGLEKGFDVIVSNPPYVSPQEYERLMPEVREFEPKEALVAGEGGTFFHKKIIANADRYLRADGFLLMECAPAQAELLRNILQEHHAYTNMKAVKDYSGNVRVIMAQRGTG